MPEQVDAVWVSAHEAGEGVAELLTVAGQPLVQEAQEVGQFHGIG